MRRVAHRVHVRRQTPVRGKLHRLQHDAEDETPWRGPGAAAEFRPTRSRSRAPARITVTGVGVVPAELAQLPVLHEEQEPKERRVLVVRLAEAANHRRDFVARARLGIGQRSEPAGELDVVALERLPHQLVFACEVAVERAFGNIDRACAMSRTLVSATPFSTKSWMAAASMRSRVSVNRCRGMCW